MDVVLIDAIVLAQAGAQARRVEDRAGADQVILGNAGELQEGIGQNVDRVADDDIDRVGRILRDLGDDHLGDVHIGLRQLKAGLAGLSGNAGRQDHDVRAGSVAVVAGIDRARVAERRALTDVERLTKRLLAVDVDHHDLGRETHDRQRVGNGRTDAAGSDDCNFVHSKYLHFHTINMPYINKLYIYIIVRRISQATLRNIPTKIFAYG